MATLQNLVDEVVPFAPGAPEAAALWAYRRAAREFFTRTLAWRKELSFAAIAQAAQTALAPGADLEAFDAVQCWYDARKLVKGTNVQAKRELGVDATTHPPAYFRVDDVNSLVISPAPPAVGKTIVLIANVRPTLTAATLDDAMVNKYGEMLERGALAYLLRMPRQPWTQYESAADNDDRFQMDIDKVSVLGVDGGVGTPRRVKYGGL